ncbi:uncharacterized protein LOC111830048 [Capsella rubella]|uniref:uncharacterized protein LOC111830048 n=1 Tax=Capsella rubella TaxID=81985 RepID=UPI000CD55BC7|nr:uncharacterized protein LOC111830048 [Capsella rubella]
MKTAKEKRCKSKSRDEKLRHRKKKKKVEMKKRKRASASVAPEKPSVEKEEEPEMKDRGEITSLDDPELWAEFETEGIDRILRGEIKPKTLITTGPIYASVKFPQRGPHIAEELVSVFPNSKYFRRRINSQLTEVIEFAISYLKEIEPNEP